MEERKGNSIEAQFYLGKQISFSITKIRFWNMCNIKAVIMESTEAFRAESNMLFHYDYIFYKGINLIVYSVKGNENLSIIKGEKPIFPVQFFIIKKYYKHLKNKRMFCCVHKIGNSIYINYVLKGKLIQSKLINDSDIDIIKEIVEVESEKLLKLFRLETGVYYITNIKELSCIYDKFQWDNEVIYDL